MERRQTDPMSGEAGNTTRDRQPASPDAAREGDREGPPAGRTASPKQVQQRSRDAQEAQNTAHEQPDQLRPGPDAKPKQRRMRSGKAPRRGGSQ